MNKKHQKTVVDIRMMRDDLASLADLEQDNKIY